MSATTLTPVTVLTGFLGSGKSTLLNRVLHDTRYADTAVIVNEFGDIPIDHALVRRASENVVVLSGGCVCCRVAGDLVQALRDLHFKRAANEIPAFRRAVIETTGLADPAPLLATLVEMPVVAARYALSGVVTTVDGMHGASELDQHPEAVKQAAVADRLVITKADLADDATLDALEARLAALNPAAARIRARSGDVDASWLFDTGLHRHDGSRPDVTGWLGANEWRSFAQPSSRGPHDERIRSFTWTAEAPVSWDALEAALETVLELRGDRILRLKGLVNVGDKGPLVLHAVQHTLYPPAKLPDWPDNDRRTRLVFITRDLERGAIAPILDSFTSTSSAS
ncbi:P-loop guanosine triphosphatase YjiA [Usitatibacter rugosus]|uniref:P-loop guanosine triphosphatase YjiA n=1 Tax=Usitatibacter rugosus TaxID=2732067 RepID=A0A6M4H3R9_9PROT|nr:GTP-binding protein [Usitatibacter rugosus]QJR12497.1 P-loop guanosine triphosphatase YjiA [Usitatibacter rugosus]